MLRNLLKELGWARPHVGVQVPISKSQCIVITNCPDCGEVRYSVDGVAILLFSFVEGTWRATLLTHGTVPQGANLATLLRRIRGSAHRDGQ